MNTEDLYSHPLAGHYLTILRDKNTSEVAFRQATRGVTHLLLQEAARALPTMPIEIETPLESTTGVRLAGTFVIVPILRAGLGMLDAAMEILPGASVGYIGLERDEETAVASCYYSKMPPLEEDTHVFVVDPMLATGGSAVQSIEQIKALGARHITMVAIIAAPEGVRALEEAHPDVTIVTGVVDRSLDENAYIRPGLGDFGDRLFGT